jgi:hypothetical protein
MSIEAALAAPERRLAIAVGDWRLCLELAAAHDGPISAWPLRSGQAEFAAGQSYRAAPAT